MVAPIKLETVDDAVCALRRLGRHVRPRGRRRWLAQCPAHDDNRHSLSVAEGEHVPLLLHCHAGCSFADVRAILRGERPPVPLSGHHRYTKKRRRPPPGPVHWYDYRDEQGRLLYQHGRTPDKEFPFRMPPRAHGRASRWGLQPGVRRVLYHLPQLARARSGQWVFVVEGEKDADRLAALGQVATCNDSGAGKWPEGCDHHFRDLDVVILPDNDPPGLAHARMVARRLAPLAARVFQLKLPGLPPKGDISDWLDAGHDLHELLALCNAARRDRAPGRPRLPPGAKGRGKEREGEPREIGGRWPRGPLGPPRQGFVVTLGMRWTYLSPVYENSGGYRVDAGQRHRWVLRHGKQVVAESRRGPVFVLLLSEAQYKQFKNRQYYRRRCGRRQEWWAVPLANCAIPIAGAASTGEPPALPPGEVGVVVFHIDAAEGGEPVPRQREGLYRLLDSLVDHIPAGRKAKGSADWGKEYRGSRGDGREQSAAAVVSRAQVVLQLNQLQGEGRVAPYQGMARQTVSEIKANSRQRPRPLLLGMLRDELWGKQRKSVLSLLTQRLQANAVQLWSKDNIRRAAWALELRLDPLTWRGRTRIAPEDAFLRLWWAGLELSTRTDRPPMAHFLAWLLPEPAPLRDSAQNKQENKPVQNPIGGLAPNSEEENDDGPRPPSGPLHRAH